MSVAHLALLGTLPLAHELAEADRAALLAVLRPRELVAGEVLFHQGDQGDTLVLVGRGLLEVSRVDAGVRTELGTLGIGALAGEMALLDPEPRAATVVAAHDSLVFELGRIGLHRLRATCPAASTVLVGEVIRIVTARLRQMDERITQELEPDPSRRAPPRSNRPVTSTFTRLWARLAGE